MVYVEPTFPRGRKVETEEDRPRKKFKKNVDYGASTTSEERPQKPRQKERKHARLEQLEQEKEDLEQSIKANPLQFNSIEEGMLVLGCVYKIHKMELIVSLPGQLFGMVSITSISEAYTKRLQSVLEPAPMAMVRQCPELSELYEVGDMVYVKVKEKDIANKRLALTLDPKELHAEISYKHLVEGLVLSATIEEEEDHGYMMNVGINNVRAFLPTKNVRKNKTHIGSNLYCSVEKVTQSTGSAIVVLKAFNPTEPRTLNIAQANLTSLVPGSVVSFTVESVLPHGLQGTLFDDTVPAFVNENMLDKPLTQLQSYQLFQQLQARILYIMPLTKHVFLTLANFENNKVAIKDPIAPGTVIKDAKIVRKTSSGIWFQIGKRHKALLPKHILHNKYKQNFDEQIVMAKYQINSVHTVRIIRYEAFDRTLIVSDDDQTVAIKYFTFADVSVGQLYDCRVTKVFENKRGCMVSLGRINGIVRSFNASGGVVTPNQTVRLRLMSIDSDKNVAEFSNHPQYLKKSAKLVTARADVKVGNKYHGTVISEKDTFFLVAFCNKITAILFKYCREVAQDVDQIAGLKPGVVSLFTVHDVSEDGERITLAIPLLAGSKDLGEIYNATITGVYATGADIYLVKENETGNVPPEMYSDFPSHNNIFQNLLKEGEQLPVAKILDNVYSRRDVEYFKRKPTLLQQVSAGQVLRAYHIGGPSSDGMAQFQLALRDYGRKVMVPKKRLLGAGQNHRQLTDGQVVLMKVLRKVSTPDGTLLRLDQSLKEVCSQGADDAFRYMQIYMNDVKDLIKRFKSQDKSFAEYTIGEVVTCTVDSFVADSDQMVVSLEEGEGATKAIATKSPKLSYTIGQQLEGRVVWLDVEKQLVHVCVVKKYFKHLTEDAKEDLFNVDEKRTFVSLFQNEYVAVGIVKDVECPLVIIPVRCHYNDFESGPVDANCKVVLMRKFGTLVYGMTEESYEKFSKLTFKMKQKPQKASDDPKHCWLPENYEEPVLEEGDDDAASDDDQEPDEPSDSGIDKDDETEEVQTPQAKPPSTKQTKKKTNKKQKKKQSSVPEQPPKKGGNKKQSAPVAASPAKQLKQTKANKKLATKKLKKVKPFVISQLDGADDGPAVAVVGWRKGQNKRLRKHFLSNGPTADVGGGGGKQSGFGKQEKTSFQSKQGKKHSKSQAKEAALLPGAESFWSAQPVVSKPESDSSDDDEQQSAPAKKRLTAKERFEALKEEEKRIRQIEEELADASVDPHTPDQFDRLVLAQPNSSLLWIRYMAFHMQAAEVEKARAVARRALQAINFREENERLNVWIALLNLEIRYETVDAFKEVLKEAAKYNDPFKVYSKVVPVLIDCEKTAEVFEIIAILQKRFRKQPEMWFLMAETYYQVGQPFKVKPLLSKALKSLENKDHIPLIVKFAFLHNRHDDRDEAHLLFEQILTSYPKRTDIWSQYVDMLVKDGLVEVARQTLDRAIVQRLPMRNMKTLFTKYVAFEEKHGDPEAVQRIKQAAAEYVRQQLSATGVKSAN